MHIRDGSVWENIKTKTLYKVLHMAKHSETKASLVVYQALGMDQVWVRPHDLFLQKFEWRHD